MSSQSPRLLLELAIDSLLREEVLAMDAVEYLPGELFPPVFMEAFQNGQTLVMKSMVQSWPFLSLPLGSLLSMRKGGTLNTQEDIVQAQKMVLQAVLDGLDRLMNQKVGSRRLKLRVLDMRVMSQDFWKVWAGNQSEGSASESTTRRKTAKTGPGVSNEKSFKIILDLQIKEGCIHPVASSLLQWVQGRQDQVQLDCPQLHISGMCLRQVTKVLEVLNLDSVQEVHVSLYWTLFTLAQVAPFLGRMKNLHKLIFSNISVPASFSLDEGEQLISKITSQFLKLHCLRELFLDSVEFLEGHLDQILRCLKSPLETLSVTNCQLSVSDWNQLRFSEQMTQLKHLDLSCTRLTSFSPEPLQHLLRNVSATLTTLHLENCGITDAQLSAFLPSLSRCSQLTTFCFINNSMAVRTLRNLLSHTARLSNLKQELYCIPQEVYDFRHGAHPQMWHEFHESLRGILKTLNHPRNIWLCIFYDEFCLYWKLYKLHPNPCPGCIMIK